VHIPSCPCARTPLVGKRATLLYSDASDALERALARLATQEPECRWCAVAETPFCAKCTAENAVALEVELAELRAWLDERKAHRLRAP